MRLAHAGNLLLDSESKCLTSFCAEEGALIVLHASRGGPHSADICLVMHHSGASFDTASVQVRTSAYISLTEFRSNSTNVSVFFLIVPHVWCCVKDCTEHEVFLPLLPSFSYARLMDSLVWPVAVHQAACTHVCPCVTTKQSIE